MSVIGRTSRVIPLGVKLDECPACQSIAAHAVARRVRWIQVLRAQLIRLGSDHVLVCGNCGHQAHLADRLVARSIKSRSLQLERDRPGVEAALVARTAAGVGVRLPPISSPTPDLAAARANAEHRLEEVVPVRAPDRQALYDRAWPALATVLAIAVFGGGWFLASQAAGITVAGQQASPRSASASTAPASSSSLKPTPAPTQRPFETDFNWWKLAYRAHLQPCYTGGTCELNWSVRYSDGTSAPLAAEAVRLAGLYRDYDSLEMGSVADCRQEHGSMYALLASIASEIEVLQALRPEDQMPKRRVALDVEFEPCSTTPPGSRAGATVLRESLADARALLVGLRKHIRAKDWSGAREASLGLTEVAATIMRTAARDFPPATDSTWAPIRGAGWDLTRVSGLIEVKRLAGAKSTSQLIDATIKSIDEFELLGRAHRPPVFRREPGHATAIGATVVTTEGLG